MQKTNDLHKVELSPTKQAALRAECEAAKEALSSQESTEVVMEDFVGDLNLQVELTRREFEVTCGSLLLAMTQLVDDCLVSADWRAEHVDRVVLAGGTTRVPFIRRQLEDMFPDKVNTSLDPDLSISLGAAVYGYHLQHASALDMVIFQDVTAMQFGIRVKGGVFAPVIASNTVLPCTAGQTFTTTEPYQKQICFAVYEGESIEVKNNRKIGEFTIRDVPDGDGVSKKGLRPFYVELTVTTEGMIRVTATDEVDKTKTAVLFDYSSGGYTQEEREELHKRSQQFVENRENIKKCCILREALANLCESSLGILGRGIATRTDAEKAAMEKLIAEIRKDQLQLTANKCVTAGDLENLVDMEAAIRERSAEIKQKWAPMEVVVDGDDQDVEMTVA